MDIHDLRERANEFARNGDDAAAEPLWREYLRHDPTEPTVNFNLGVCMMRRAKSPEDRKEAADFYEKTIFHPATTMERRADAWNNLGLMAEAVGGTEEAAVAYGFALKCFPSHSAARINLGDAKRFLGDWRGAQDEYKVVLDQDPNSSEAHLCAGMIALLLGDYERGWREYRWRFGAASFQTTRFKSEKPMWDGEDLSGKTLIVATEQGHGDALMFVRYFAEVKKLHPDCKIYFSVTGGMHRLLKGCAGLDGCLTHYIRPEFSDACPPFDYHVPLLNLPAVLGTTLATIPASTPYIVPHADWLPLVLEPTGKTRRIGLCWAGSPAHGKDKARSITPELFKPLLIAAHDAQFYSFQCGPRAHEVVRLWNCVDLSPGITDWSQTASAMLQMDLVITVDTAIVHLAGALGVPCWMLTPHSPDFRWMLEREDSPWYPRLRLFRQPAKDDWLTPIQRICEAL